jgi:hypothetical protein
LKVESDADKYQTAFVLNQKNPEWPVKDQLEMSSKPNSAIQVEVRDYDG